VLGTTIAGMLLACCPCAFALNPTLDISEYAHTTWKVGEGFSKRGHPRDCSDARRLSVAGYGIRLASLRRCQELSLAVG
jgi:hypothetical protein